MQNLEYTMIVFLYFKEENIKCRDVDGMGMPTPKSCRAELKKHWAPCSARWGNICPAAPPEGFTVDSSFYQICPKWCSGNVI